MARDSGSKNGISVQFGLAIDHGIWKGIESSRGVSAVLDCAVLAEEAGFDSIWVNEDPDGWDAFQVLAACAGVTTSVRLGTGVTNHFHRPPSLMAASVATLDRLTNGRAFLGIGRGQPDVYKHALGLDVSDPLSQMESTIALLRSWWRAPFTASNAGIPFVSRLQRTIGPTQAPPIYIAAVGPKALELAGRVANGVLFNELATPQYVNWAVAQVRSSAVSAGRDPAELSFFANPALTVTSDPESVFARKKAFVAMVHALPGMDRLLMTETFDVPEIMARVRSAMKTEEVLARGGLFPELREAGDIEAAKSMIPDGLIEEASAIGSIEYVQSKVRDFVAAGATHLFVDRRGLPADSDQVRELLRDVSLFLR
ncbi:LLM class F420-dependent oxidoreductase [soil metagenome]